MDELAGAPPERISKWAPARSAEPWYRQHACWLYGSKRVRDGHLEVFFPCRCVCLILAPVHINAQGWKNNQSHLESLLQKHGI